MHQSKRMVSPRRGCDSYSCPTFLVPSTKIRWAHNDALHRYSAAGLIDTQWLPILHYRDDSIVRLGYLLLAWFEWRLLVKVPEDMKVEAPHQCFALR